MIKSFVPTVIWTFWILNSFSQEKFLTISNMCRNTIRRELSESAVKTILTPRHGGSQSCRSCPQQTAMTLKQMEVTKLSSDKKKMFVLNYCVCSKRSSMQQNKNPVSTSYLTSSLHVFIFLWNASTRFYKLFATQASSMRSSSYSQSSFPLRFILLTFCILSGKATYILISYYCYYHYINI